MVNIPTESQLRILISGDAADVIAKPEETTGMGVATIRVETRPCPLYDAIRNGIREAIAKARRRRGCR